MNDSLFIFLASIKELSSDLKAGISNCLQKETHPKKTIILKEGEVCHRLYFIEKGFVRAFYRRNNQEITSWFMTENQMIISVNSFFSQKPGYENIEVLEDTTLISITYNDLQRLYYEFPEFNYVGRVLTEYYYSLSEERLFGMRMQSTQEKYEMLLKNHSEIFKRAPLKYIASYLGMKPETLSRLRGLTLSNRFRKRKF